MLLVSRRTFVLLLISFFTLLLLVSFPAYPQLFPFVKCTGDDKNGGVASICQFCLAGSATGNDKVCSKSYNTNPGAKDPTPGFSNISKELTDDLTNKLVKLKEFPVEGFEVRDFYKKYADYSCERGDQELQWIERQIEYLQWKMKKIKESQANKACDKENKK